MDIMFSNNFSNDLTDERPALGFEYSSPEVHANGSTVRSASGVAEMSYEHVITHSARLQTLQVLQYQSDYEATDLARVYHWTRGRVTLSQCLQILLSSRMAPRT